MRTFISLVWLALWSMPFIVALCGNSVVLVAIGIIWGVIMKLFTDAYAPQWLIDELNRFSRS